MKESDIDKVANAYIFEVNATHKIRLTVSPRPNGYFDEVDEEKISKNNYVLRPLLIGKGMDDFTAESLKTKISLHL